MIVTCHGRSRDPRLLRNTPGSLGRILHDDEGALVGLAELMALDGPDLTTAQRRDIVETIFSRI